MEEQQQYVSGQGKNSTVPPEIKGWNWGAFLLNWVWGIGNSTYIALLMFVPFVNIVMLFVLGAKGNQWAWQNRIWTDVEHFKRTQRRWALSGLAIIFIAIPLLLFSISSMLKGEAYKKSLEVISSNSEVIELVGSPIKAGYFVLGNIKVSGSNGKTSLEYSILGSKAEAEVYVLADKRMNQWNLSEVVVYNEELNVTIQVVKPTKK